MRNRIAKWQQFGRRLLLIQELGGKCVDCGEEYPLFLEFDHKDPLDKKCNIAEKMALQAMRTEAAKCELRCSNCHRLKSWIYRDKSKWRLRKEAGT